MYAEKDALPFFPAERSRPIDEAVIAEHDGAGPCAVWVAVLRAFGAESVQNFKAVSVRLERKNCTAAAFATLTCRAIQTAIRPLNKRPAGPGSIRVGGIDKQSGQ